MWVFNSFGAQPLKGGAIVFDRRISATIAERALDAHEHEREFVLLHGSSILRACLENGRTCYARS